MRRQVFRHRLSPGGRVLRSLALVALCALGVALAARDGLAAELRVGGAFAALVGLVGLRALFGGVVVVTQASLRVQPFWPFRRDVAWYRVASVDHLPGFGHVEVVLNSGERLVLPAVERPDELTESIARCSQALDA